MLISIFFAGCKSSPDEMDYSNFTRVNKKGKFSIYLPNYLVPDKKINRNAELSYADTLNNTFFMVIREEIPDTESDSITIELNNYAVFAANAITEALTDPQIIARDTLQIDQHPSCITTMSGKYGGQRVYYIQAVVETDDFFYQLTGWTLGRFKDTRGADLRNACLSFTDEN